VKEERKREKERYEGVYLTPNANEKGAVGKIKGIECISS
jgi:hypothetical protein